MLKGTTIGTTTDETGHYFLKNLSEGTFTVEVSSIGYKTERRTVQLTKGKTLELNFEIGEDHVALEGVVVSANRNETTRRMAPTLVNVVSVKTFENTNSTCLAQGLNFQPGVRVENNCQNCGYQQVRINGLDGPYTQILIDSRPIFSALAGVYGTCGGDARRRLGFVWLFGHCRHHQHHYQGTGAQLGPVLAHTDGDRRCIGFRKQYHNECFAGIRQPEAGTGSFRTEQRTCRL